MSEVFNWSKYVGIRYVHRGRNLSTDGGLDCYGLVRHWYKQELGIVLPEWYVLDSDIKPAEIEQSLETNQIHNQNPLVETSSPSMGDVILLRVLGHPVHVGIYIDQTYFLHTRCAASMSEIARMDKWRNKVDAYYTVNN